METIAIFGASGGLGSGIAENLSRHYRLILGYHTNFDAVETLKKKIITAGGSVETVAVDIRDPDSVAELLESSTKLKRRRQVTFWQLKLKKQKDTQRKLLQLRVG